MSEYGIIGAIARGQRKEEILDMFEGVDQKNAKSMEEMGIDPFLEVDIISELVEEGLLKRTENGKYYRVPEKSCG